MDSTNLEHTFMSGMLLQFYQTVEDDQLYIIVALLDDQVDVALGSSLEPHISIKLKTSALWNNI